MNISNEHSIRQKIVWIMLVVKSKDIGFYIASRRLWVRWLQQAPIIKECITELKLNMSGKKWLVVISGEVVKTLS